jgi:excisionase family DNA binding protein
MDNADIPAGTRRVPELPSELFFTVAEVAATLRVSKMTIYRLIHSGELRAVRFAHTYRVPRAAVEEYISMDSFGPAQRSVGEQA